VWIRQNSTRAWHLFVTVCCLGVALWLPAFLYWGYNGFDPAKCVYADAGCSVAFATYLLCALTLGAFLAAYKAAVYAQQAFEHERTSVLAAQECLCEHARGDFKATVFLTDLRRGFVSEAPPSSHYRVANIDCISVGRSPVVNCSLQVSVTGDGGRFSYPIEIGSVGVNSKLHLKINVLEALGNVRLEWVPLETQHKMDPPMLFYPRTTRINLGVEIPFGDETAVEKPLTIIPTTPKKEGGV
jgi:hypothetical protein